MVKRLQKRDYLAFMKTKLKLNSMAEAEEMIKKVFDSTTEYFDEECKKGELFSAQYPLRSIKFVQRQERKFSNPQDRSKLITRAAFKELVIDQKKKY